jgi:hypothetical protein
MALVPESPTMVRFGCGGQGRWGVAAGKRRESVDENGPVDYAIYDLVDYYTPLTS